MTTQGSERPKRARKKRPDGDGCVYFDSKAKLWRAELMVGQRSDGKDDIRKVSSRQQAACMEKLNKLKDQRDKGELGDPSARSDTVAAFLLRWLDAIRATVRDSTHYRYRMLVNTHLIPALGARKLVDLKPDHLVKLFEDKRVGVQKREKGKGRDVNGLSPRTVKYLYTTLRKALDMAVKWNAVSRNVARSVDAPKVPRPEMDFMTPLQVRTLLTAATESGSRFAELWAVAVTTGARSGELRGLKWSDINLDRGTISIVRTLASIKDGVPTFNAPKTTRSRRTVTISGEAVAALRRVQDRQTFERQRLKEAYANMTDLVFTTELGKPLEASNTLHAFKRALKAAGLPDKYRVHDLRHAAATLMLLAKVHPKVVSERLGHASVSITLDLYSHVLEGLDSDAADKIEEAIRNAV